MSSEEIENAVTVGDALGELVKNAGDSEEGKRAASNLGKAAVTLTEAVNNCLLPIAAVNYAFAKAKNYFASRFESDIAGCTADIPPDSLIEPKASLAGPALQGIAFSHDEPDLKELYLRLLATAMDSRNANAAHPAFVEILRQLDADEAKLLKVILRHNQFPIGTIKQTLPQNSVRVLWKHLMAWTDDDTGEVAVNLRLPAMVDNWIRLGIVEVSYTRWMSDPTEYAWMETRPEVEKLKSLFEKDTSTVLVDRGILERTALGQQFAIATGIIKGPAGIFRYFTDPKGQETGGN